MAKKGDILITISSSGKSKNIIRALKWSNKNDVKTISFTGFDGGESKKIAKLNIHASSYNYGVVENIHHAIMNIISQFLRQGSNNLNGTINSYGQLCKAYVVLLNSIDVGHRLIRYTERACTPSVVSSCAGVSIPLTASKSLAHLSVVGICFYERLCNDLYSCNVVCVVHCVDFVS